LIEAPQPGLVPSFEPAKRAKLGDAAPSNITPPTLEEVRQAAPWLWVHCRNVACMHRAPMALTPLIIRWGVDASRDWLRKSARWLPVAPRQLTLEYAPAARSRERFSSHSCGGNLVAWIAAKYLEHFSIRAFWNGQPAGR
jgi:hypothetical protein